MLVWSRYILGTSVNWSFSNQCLGIHQSRSTVTIRFNFEITLKFCQIDYGWLRRYPPVPGFVSRVLHLAPSGWQNTEFAEIGGKTRKLQNSDKHRQEIADMIPFRVGTTYWCHTKCRSYLLRLMLTCRLWQCLPNVINEKFPLCYQCLRYCHKSGASVCAQ